MSSNGSEAGLPPLLVSTLTVHIKSQCRKGVGTIIVEAGTIKKAFPQAISPGGSHQERQIPLHMEISVSIRFRSVFHRVVSISLNPKTVLSEASEKDGKQVYCKTVKNIEVVVGIQSLPSTANEVLASCSRFRVLVMGKSGVGKSSLITKVFGISGMHESDTTRGEATIDEEHIVPDNDRLIVHDGSGFEAGDRRGLDGVCDFIVRRRGMQDLKDRLHAIWLCLEIPIVGGRVLETGVEEFLKERDRILGDTPLVVVFTKVDSLVDMLRAQALQAGQFLDGDALEEREREALEEHCFGPIRTALKNNDVPSVAVSTEDYEGGLAELVEKTTNIQKHERVHCVAMMAQRVNIALKVEATIAVGGRKYWNMLTESQNFQGQTMKACLDLLHKDIVTVWNFKDTHHSLYRQEFKEALLKSPKRPAQSSSVIAALVTIIGGLAVRAVDSTPSVTLPVAGTTILNKLAHNLYNPSEDIVRQLMRYIIDLTCVMQILFLVIAAQEGDVSAEIVGAALEAYEQTYRPNVHDDINKFSVHGPSGPENRDDAFYKIKELIGKYRIRNEDVMELRSQLQSA